MTKKPFCDIALDLALTETQKAYISGRTFVGKSKIAVLRELVDLGIDQDELRRDLAKSIGAGD